MLSVLYHLTGALSSTSLLLTKTIKMGQKECFVGHYICCKTIFFEKFLKSMGVGAVAIAGGERNFLGKSFSLPLHPPHSSKTFQKMGFATDILQNKTFFLTPL